MYRQSQPNPGFTLYEIVLSLAILMGSLAVIADLVGSGGRAAIGMQRRTEALLLCQTKLARLVAGEIPLTTTEQASVEESPGDEQWLWNVQVTDGPHVDLLQLRVDVAHSDEPATPLATLIRFTRNPLLFEEMAAQEAASEETSE